MAGREFFALELGVSTKGTNDHFAEFDVTSPTAHVWSAASDLHRGGVDAASQNEREVASNRLTK